MSISTDSPASTFLSKSAEILSCINKQLAQISTAADWFAESILKQRMVHVFGAGHSRIMVEEMWPRYGSFPGFNPIVELSMTFHHPVVGCNGQRQAMFIENTPGLAARILRNFDLQPADSALVVSSSGCSRVAVEMAQEFQRRGIKVVGMVSLAHAQSSQSRMPEGEKLMDFADLVLDTGAPEGDAMVEIKGLDVPVAPGSTVGGCLLVNSIKAEVAHRLTQQGQPPRVLTASNLIGRERSAALFEAAYDEHGRRIARLFGQLGEATADDACPPLDH